LGHEHRVDEWPMSSGSANNWPQVVGAGDPPGAIVIGSDYIALGVVRSLGRKGIPVWVLRDSMHAEAAVSRYARRCLPWPADPADRLALLLKIPNEYGLNNWTLFPTDDEAAALVARNHEELAEHFYLTTPPWETLQWAYDKRQTHGLAVRLDIGQPWTRFPRDEEAVAALECSFPVVLKPAVKNLTNAFTLARAWRIDDRRQLLDRYAEAAGLVPPDVIMVQELIPGGSETRCSFAALCADGRPLAWLTAQRSRQFPIDFSRGSTFVETIQEPAIEQLSRRLLAEIRYTGLVEVEFKRDPRTGEYKLLDINARTWGWHTLGRRAGIDFPFLSWQLVHGTAIAEIHARPGVRWIRALTDFRAVLAEIRRGQLSIPAYLRSIRPPFECAILAFDDPVPALSDLPSIIRRSWYRGKVQAGAARASST
jgi:predicted ATP-grasp superfamily ATP-dependent carboligase